ncbi:hypothetical protein D3C84_916520 [compost metagenome]
MAAFLIRHVGRAERLGETTDRCQRGLQLMRYTRYEVRAHCLQPAETVRHYIEAVGQIAELVLPLNRYSHGEVAFCQPACRPLQLFERLDDVMRRDEE